MSGTYRVPSGANITAEALPFRDALDAIRTEKSATRDFPAGLAVRFWRCYRDNEFLAAERGIRQLQRCCCIYEIRVVERGGLWGNSTVATTTDGTSRWGPIHSSRVQPFRAFVGLLLTVSEPTTTKRDLLCHAVSVDKEHHDFRHAGGMPQRAAGTQHYCATHSTTT